MKAILCIDDNGCIGKNNDIIFDIKKDKVQFKKYTNNKILIMGRKTYESLPHKLKDRIHIVITNNKKYKPKDSGVYVVNSIDELQRIKDELFPHCDDDNFIVIGGASIYNLLIPECTEVMVTHVHLSTNGDTQINMDILEGFSAKVVSRTTLEYDRNAEKNNSPEKVPVTFEYYYK